MSKSKSAEPQRTYPDLHDHIAALRKAGLLIEVDRPICKDTEMHPLVRWQFRGGFPEHERKAFLFTNVHDAKGNKFDIPVVVGCLAASREIYRIGLGCPLDKIAETRGYPRSYGEYLGRVAEAFGERLEGGEQLVTVPAHDARRAPAVVARVVHPRNSRRPSHQSRH